MGALFNKKEPQQEGDEHALEDTARRLLSKLQLFHTVARAGEQARPLHDCVLSSSVLPLAWCQSAATRVAWIARVVIAWQVAVYMTTACSG